LADGFVPGRLTDRQHDDDRRHAEDDAESGQDRPQPVGEEAAKAEAERVWEAAERHGFTSGNAELRFPRPLLLRFRFRRHPGPGVEGHPLAFV
jgi:hypothetical protein